MRWGTVNRAGSIVLLQLSVVLCPAAAAAALSGYVDLNYNHAITRSEDTTGKKDQSRADVFVQRYLLNFDQRLYPHLNLRVGYLFEQDLAKVETGESDSRTTLTRMFPSAELSLNPPEYRAAIGYSRIEQKQDVRGASATTEARDTFTAGFGLARKVARPTLDILYTRTYNYDKERLSRDQVNDLFTVSSRYTPVSKLDLKYQGAYQNFQDRLQQVETTGLVNTGRVSYGNLFFEKRLSLSTTYQVSHQMEEISTSGTGDVTFPRPATQGISGAGKYGTDELTETPENDTMVSKPLLIDGDFETPTDINIGFTPDNLRKRNIGLVFAVPTDVNRLSVWVDQDISAIAGSYSWDVYITSDTSPISTGPKQWTLWQQAAPASFNSFDKRFEITFPTVQTQLIKLVVLPLQSPVPVPNVDTSRIMVTELSAAEQVPAADVPDRTTRGLSQIFDLSTRVKITETPLLYYDLYYYATRTDPAGVSQFILSNTLSASQRLSRVFSVNARVGREDGETADERTVAHVYSLSVTATPLETLSHSLVVSGRRQDFGEESVDSDSAFLSNVFQLYRGLDLNLSGGVSYGKLGTGLDTSSTIVNAGATVIPHKAVTVNLNHSNTIAEQSGAAVGEIVNRIDVNSASIALTPVRALYLFGSLTLTSSNRFLRTTTQNYTASWSPFFGGSLVLSIAYNEILRTPGNQRFSALSPTIRWNINPRLYLEGFYSRLRNDTEQSDNTTDSINGRLRWIF